MQHAAFASPLLTIGLGSFELLQNPSLALFSPWNRHFFLSKYSSITNYFQKSTAPASGVDGDCLNIGNPNTEAASIRMLVAQKSVLDLQLSTSSEQTNLKSRHASR